MNVVIPLRDRSILQDWELRYCIKSIRKFTNAEVIFIVSKKRDVEFPGNSGKIVWIDYQDKYPAKNPTRHENVRLKVIAAGEAIRKPFLLMNDDMFFLKKTDITTIPLYYWKTCKEFAKNKGGRYRQMLERINGLNFELHLPIIVDPNLFKAVTKSGELYRSVYCNASSLPKKERKDVKIQRLSKVDDIISTSETALKNEIKDLIMQACD